MAKVPKNIENAINEFVNGINRILKNRVKKIILYGSYARGDYRKNSDLDIMVLTYLSEDEIVEMRTKLWDYSYDIGLDNDIVISSLFNKNSYKSFISLLFKFLNCFNISFLFIQIISIL